MSSAGYKILGWAVWKGGAWYLRRRFGSAPLKIAAVLAVATGIGAFGVAQRRSANRA